MGGTSSFSSALLSTSATASHNAFSHHPSHPAHEQPNASHPDTERTLLVNMLSNSPTPSLLSRYTLPSRTTHPIQLTRSRTLAVQTQSLHGNTPLSPPHRLLPRTHTCTPTTTCALTQRDPPQPPRRNPTALGTNSVVASCVSGFYGRAAESNVAGTSEGVGLGVGERIPPASAVG
ncbi:hypothetical protein BDZ97DRAFT_1922952 [Flammula alnicola]|nr:hypothetical protein BDZ97DRAFT_1922952 [Flammula alnicola]